MNNLRVFKTKSFAKFAAKERISDDRLKALIADIEMGKVDADLGGGLIKQRLGRVNQGKSGGYRVIILYRKAHRLFFAFGFTKNRQETLSSTEEKIYKTLAIDFLNYLTNKLSGKLAKDLSRR